MTRNETVNVKVKVDEKGVKTLNNDLQKTNKEVDELNNKQKKGGFFKSGTWLKMTIGIAAVGMAIKKVGDFVGDLVSAYDTQIKAERSLTTALGYKSQALFDQASALQKVTRYGDEQIIQGQAYAAMMGLSEKQIKKLTPIILDFAQAKGIDVKQAFDLVTKSIGSETNALSRYGIEIEGAKGSNERLDSAVNSLTEKFKGQAEEMAKIGSGPMIQLENAYGDLKESAGGVLSEVINKFAPAITESLQQTTDYLNNKAIPSWNKFLSLIVGSEMQSALMNANEIEKSIRKMAEEDAKKGLTAEQRRLKLEQIKIKYSIEAAKAYAEQYKAQLKLNNLTKKENDDDDKNKNNKKQLTGIIEKLREEIKKINTEIEQSKTEEDILFNQSKLKKTNKELKYYLTLFDELDKKIKSLNTTKKIDNGDLSIKPMVERNEEYLAEAVGNESFQENLKMMWGQLTTDQKTNILKQTASDLAEIGDMFLQAKINLANQELDITLNKLNREKEAELNNKELTERERRIIEDKYQAKELEARKKAFEKIKEYEKAQVIMKSASAIIGTWAGYSEFGPYGTIMAALQTAMIGAETAVQLQQIDKQQYAQGGILNGPSHQQGGIPTPYGELEGQEIVLTKGVTQNPALASLASSINVAGGGSPFAPQTQLIDYDLLASKINDKKVIVTEYDITKAQQNNKKVAVSATLQ